MNDSTKFGEGKLYINGAWRASSAGEIVDDHDPATGAVIARVHQAGLDDVDAAISAAFAARRAWGSTLAATRERILLDAADVLERRASEVAAVLVAEAGSVMFKAGVEVALAAGFLRSAAGECRRITGETLPSDSPALFSMTVRRPLGVVAGIAPFNFPLLLATKKVAFALAAGNTFVLKPSEETPLSNLVIAEILEQAGLPPGVLNVLPGPGPLVGEALVTDPRVRLITFTGSTRVGRRLAELAGRHMKRITLEMGGKSPMIVLRDADLDYAVDAACFGAFLHQGQACMASSRILVEEPLAEAFAARLTAKVQALPVGDPRDPRTIIGPLIRRSQVELVDRHVHDARRKGATVLTGGTARDNFYEPTVLAHVDASMDVYREESFGPVVSVIAARDAEHALHIANDTSYGLSAAVVTNDLQKAFDLSERLDAGMVHINNCTVNDEPNVPFGGIKDSGFGREGGRHSMDAMTEIKWITVQLGRRPLPF